LGTEAVHPVDGYRLDWQNDRWVSVSESGVVRSATGRRIFIVTEDGTIYVSPRRIAGAGRVASHADLAGGRDVLYAGEIQFSGRTNRGQIRWWNNQSGHYLPGSECAQQGGMPLDLFRPFGA